MGLINSLVQFVAGTKALASEVNSNFETLRSAHNDQESRISVVEGAYLKKDGTVAMTGALDLGSQKITSLADGTSINDGVSFGQLKARLPVGSVIWVANDSAPAEYLKCDGAAISRTTYADLFAQIGTVFGVGDDSTTFSLPDLRGEFIRGWDDSKGVDSGRAFASAQSDLIKTVTLYIAAAQGAIKEGNEGMVAFVSKGAGTFNVTTGVETRPRNVALLACIKY
ncbi:MAG: hypothetical protein ACD_20C00169G0010 [uncultured bacterium]|nr:MAG: hypothetical protein ACD_20C00169G0010 [uncultured bacterium]